MQAGHWTGCVLTAFSVFVSIYDGPALSEKVHSEGTKYMNGKGIFPATTVDPMTKSTMTKHPVVLET